jgi:hypothetical protein
MRISLLVACKVTDNKRMVMLWQQDTELALCSTADVCKSTNTLIRMSLLVACQSQQTANAWSCCVRMAMLLQQNEAR